MCRGHCLQKERTMVAKVVAVDSEMEGTTVVGVVVGGFTVRERVQSLMKQSLDWCLPPAVSLYHETWNL